LDDAVVYDTYPHHRKWYNKLWLSEKLGYRCGPAGVNVLFDEEYIVRPIMNLEGMGVGAKTIKMDPHEWITIPSGHFWCEKFEGRHFSYDFEWEEEWEGPLRTPRYVKGWRQLNCWEGIRELGEEELWRWSKWVKINRFIELPEWFDELKDVGNINVECIDDNIIEVHLRSNPDPIEKHKELIVWWKDSKYPKKTYFKHGYEYIEAFDDAGGQLPMPRLGFLALLIVPRTKHQNEP
jgi:hypothetical protein